MRIKTKGIIKKIALALAGVVALSAVGFGVAKLVELARNDLKTITPTFSVGNLGADGKYVSDESTLYTKEAFHCDGLQIKLDFDNEIEYQIFFYDDLDNFVESTEVLSAAYSETVHDGYARIVIMPTNDEDEKISLTERITYPDQMTIKVAKEQNTEYVNVFNKRLRIVDNLNDLRFFYGRVDQSSGSMNFVNASKNDSIVTSKDLFFIDDFTKLIFKDDITSGQTGNLAIYTFSSSDTGVKFLSGYTAKITSSDSEGVTVNFASEVEYFVLSYYITNSESTNIVIEENELGVFYKNITLIK